MSAVVVTLARNSEVVVSEPDTVFVAERKWKVNYRNGNPVFVDMDGQVLHRLLYQRKCADVGELWLPIDSVTVADGNWYNLTRDNLVRFQAPKRGRPNKRSKYAQVLPTIDDLILQAKEGKKVDLTDVAYILFVDFAETIEEIRKYLYSNFKSGHPQVEVLKRQPVRALALDGEGETTFHITRFMAAPEEALSILMRCKKLSKYRSEENISYWQYWAEQVRS